MAERADSLSPSPLPSPGGRGRKRILVITNNLAQASFRVRIAALIEPLSRRGFNLHVQVRPRQWGARRKLLRSANEYDAVILQRKLLDPADVRLLRRCARRIYFDVDDAVMQHDEEAGWWSRWRTERRFHHTAAAVDVVVAGNDYLADLFRGRGCEVVVLPTVVDPAAYPIKSHAPTDSPRLVWIGSHSTIPYLRATLPVLEEAASQTPGLELLTIADETVKRGVLRVQHEPWSAETEAQALIRGDIGISPMPRDPWTLGKCGFKIIQYMAAGLPVIASPVGANAEIVISGETGFLPETDDQWVDAICKLAGNAELRRSMGASGRARVEKEYSVTRAVETWASIL